MKMPSSSPDKDVIIPDMTPETINIMLMMFAAAQLETRMETPPPKSTYDEEYVYKLAHQASMYTSPPPSTGTANAQSFTGQLPTYNVSHQSRYQSNQGLDQSLSDSISDSPPPSNGSGKHGNEVINALLGQYMLNEAGRMLTKTNNGSTNEPRPQVGQRRAREAGPSNPNSPSAKKQKTSDSNPDSPAGVYFALFRVPEVGGLYLQPHYYMPSTGSLEIAFDYVPRMQSSFNRLAVKKVQLRGVQTPCYMLYTRLDKFHSRAGAYFSLFVNGPGYALRLDLTKQWEQENRFQTLSTSNASKPLPTTAEMKFSPFNLLETFIPLAPGVKGEVNQLFGLREVKPNLFVLEPGTKYCHLRPNQTMYSKELYSISADLLQWTEKADTKT